MITVIAIIGLILTGCIFGLFILYKTLAEDLAEELRTVKGELNYCKAKERNIERTLQNMTRPSDKIEIIHKYDDADAPRFGGF